MAGHVRHYKSGILAKYYRCGYSWKEFKGEKKCGFNSIDTISHKIDDAVWLWLRKLLLDPNVLETGIHEIIENQSKAVTPKQQRLGLIKNLVEEEQYWIRRLIVQMSNYNDEVV